MLNGKVVLVTGGSRGIGRAISLLCAKNHANIIVNYHKSESAALSLISEIRQIGTRAIAIRADVSEKRDVDSMFKKIRAEFGKLDVLVNNAGILKDNLLLMTRESDYDDVMNVNLKGFFYCMQYAAKMMIKEQKGKIINISSVVGRYGNSGQIVYSATKAGIIGMTKSAAKELGQFGITVNSVAPGLIETDMIRHLDARIRNQLINSTALKRIGKPIDVANVVLFLASDLSDYVSGQVIGVDGCQVI